MLPELLESLGVLLKEISHVHAFQLLLHVGLEGLVLGSVYQRHDSLRRQEKRCSVEQETSSSCTASPEGIWMDRKLMFDGAWLNILNFDLPFFPELLPH